MANLHAFGDKIMGGASTGGGHTIWDRLKNALTQRSILQFGGTLQVTDNPTDGATVVDDSAFEISWDDWDAMSAAEQDAFCELHPKVDILDPPSVDGTISAELMKKLWENPSPTSAFAAQNITLSSSDYDFLLVEAQSGSYYRTVSQIVAKGHNIFLNLTQVRSDSDKFTAQNRVLAYSTDTQLSAQDATVCSYNSAESVNNNALIPTAIYGIKSTINLKLSAIASDVNTAADHCMMSDGVTSVEDKFTWKRLSNTPSSTADISNISYSELCILFECSSLSNDTFYIPKSILTNSSKLFRHGYYESASYYGDWGINVSLTSVSCFARKAGTAQTATIDVYYR